MRKSCTGPQMISFSPFQCWKMAKCSHVPVLKYFKFWEPTIKQMSGNKSRDFRTQMVTRFRYCELAAAVKLNSRHEWTVTRNVRSALTQEHSTDVLQQSLLWTTTTALYDTRSATPAASTTTSSFTATSLCRATSSLETYRWGKHSSWWQGGRGKEIFFVLWTSLASLGASLTLIHLSLPHCTRTR